MALILNIETASPVCSVCLAQDGVAIAFKEDKQGNSHARMLTLFIDEIMRTAGVKYEQLDAVAISSGPGSYTGLRIGTSVAKGLCYALNRPLLAIPTLLALAENLKGNSNEPLAVYMPVMDARRLDIYTALYDSPGNELMSARMVTINAELETMLSKFKKVLIGGNGAKKFKEAVATSFIEYIDGIECSAQAMAALSESGFRNKVFEDTAYFEPFYLHEFQPKTRAK